MTWGQSEAGQPVILCNPGSGAAIRAPKLGLRSFPLKLGLRISSPLSLAPFHAIQDLVMRCCVERGRPGVSIALPDLRCALPSRQDSHRPNPLSSWPTHQGRRIRENCHARFVMRLMRTSRRQSGCPLAAKPESVGMSSERLALIRKQIDAEIARDQLPGAVLVIARRGKLVHFEAYGYLDKVAAAVLAGLTADSISFVVRSWLWEASEAIRAIEAAVAVEHE
jgi:hypothetical protein